MKNFIISLHLIASLLNLLSCGQSNFATYTDPRENAFTVSLPSDWKTQVSLERPHGQIRSCGVSVSPDGKSKVFFGDPTLPTYMAPNPQFGMYKGANTGNPL
ncbi:MAG: hypothetical protein KDE26_14040, partial [Bacteroidetes bacterium]|nr:hypothetical protein [Bacteroidota bacterium]